jgi:hypothetical protein
MGNVYQSLREVVQDTFQRNRTNPVPATRLKTAGALTLDDEVRELEKLFIEKAGRLSARIKENDEWVAGEAKHAEDLIDSLRANIAELEIRVRETDETSRKKELIRREAEASLHAKIQDLQNDLKSRDEALEGRGNELSQLTSTIDRQTKRIAELESAVQAAQAEAAGQATRAEELAQSLQTNIAGLEAQLRDRDDIIRIKDATLKGMEENLNAKMADLQTQLLAKVELVTAQDTEIQTLKSQLKTLTKGLEQMAFLFRKAEALAADDGQALSASAASEPLEPRLEKPASFVSQKVTPVAVDGTAELVSDYTFGDIIRELAEFTNVIGLVASVIVREHVTALGESMDKFPKPRLPQLIDSLSREILDEEKKAKFRERVGKQ